MWFLIVLAAIASVPLAGHIAQSRGLSVKLWALMAVVFGPLALPMMFLVIGVQLTTTKSQRPASLYVADSESDRETAARCIRT